VAARARAGTIDWPEDTCTPRAAARASSGIAAFGLLVSAGVLLGFLSGRVGLDVHGFGLIMFSEAAWLVWIGVALCRGSNYPRE